MTFLGGTEDNIIERNEKIEEKKIYVKKIFTNSNKIKTNYLYKQKTLQILCVVPAVVTKDLLGNVFFSVIRSGA